MAFSALTVWYNYCDYFNPEHFTSGAMITMDGYIYMKL